MSYRAMSGRGAGWAAGVTSLIVMAWLPTATADTPVGPQILHLPPKQHQAEQGILTSIPIQLTIPESLRARRVLVHYKIRGTSSWTTLELVRTSDGWRGAIPCLEVSTITGDVKYYVRVHNRAGKVVAYSGTRSSPYRVHIVHDSARSSATQERPRCPDPADCPAGLPGCPSEIVEKIPCQSDSDCEGETSCGWDGFCEVDARQHTWVDLSMAQEFGAIGTTGACSLEAQENEGTLCLRRSDDAVYFGAMAYTNEPVRVGIGNTRIWMGFQHLINYDTSLTLHVGYAVAGVGPTAPQGVPFLPVSGALGAVHWFGNDPFAELGWRPFLGVFVGYGMFDIKSQAHVRADVTRYDPQGGNDLNQTLDLWKRAGDAFVAIAGGVALASDSGWALKGELSVAKTFPFSAVIISPRLGVAKGF